MESIGQKLRAERLRIGLTLEQVSASTRISLKNLDAIENDRLDAIASGFFYKSFVRQFAGCISVRYEDISQAVTNAANTMPAPGIPGRSDQNAPRVPPLRRAAVSNSKWVYSIVGLVVVLASCSTLNAVWHGKRFALDVAVQAAKPIFPKKAATRAIRKPAQSVVRPQPPSPQIMVDQFHVEISASQPTWLSIISDGKTLFSSVLQSGETRSIDGHEMARVRAGNAGGVSIHFNGKSIGLIGSPGQVRTVVFTKEKFEIVQPSSTDKMDDTHLRESGV